MSAPNLSRPANVQHALRRRGYYRGLVDGKIGIATRTAIGAYQRYLSPYKGFCCAYRAHTGRASCSALGARVIRRHGLLAGGLRNATFVPSP